MGFTRKKYKGGGRRGAAARQARAAKTGAQTPRPKQAAPQKATQKAPSAAKKAKGEAKQAATRQAMAERTAQIKAQRAKNAAATQKANANARAKRSNTKATKKAEKAKRVESAKRRQADADAAAKKRADAAAAARKKKADADAAAKKRADAAAKKKGAGGAFLGGPMGGLGSALSALGKLAGNALNDMLKGLQNMMGGFGGSFGNPSGTSGDSGTMLPSPGAAELSGDSTCSPAQKGAKQAADAARQKSLDALPYSTSTTLYRLTEIDKVWKKSIDAAKITGDCADKPSNNSTQSSSTNNPVSDDDFLKAWTACVDYIGAPNITRDTSLKSITAIINDLIKKAFTDDDKRKINIAGRVILNPANIKRYLDLLAKSRATQTSTVTLSNKAPAA
jgi:chemotaxis protein histidine kinase CheA